MVRADLAVFALGAVFLAAGLYGISTLPPHTDGASAAAWSVVWQEGSEDLTLGSATLQDGGRADVPFTVTEGNLSRLVLVFACTDRHPVPSAQTAANLDVSVAGPQNQTAQGQGRCGEPIELAIPVQDAPEARTAVGASEAEARGSLLSERTDDSTVGEWTARLSLTRASTLPVGSLGGADVQITGKAIRHEPTLTAQPR